MSLSDFRWRMLLGSSLILLGGFYTASWITTDPFLLFASGSLSFSFLQIWEKFWTGENNPSFRRDARDDWEKKNI